MLFRSVEALIEQIPDSSLTASSSFGGGHGPHRSRLLAVNDEDGKGGWIAPGDLNQWIQADFLSAKTIFKVATRGKNDEDNWVTRYQLKYSLSINEADFEYVTSTGGGVMTFNGNSDRNSVVENEFAIISARVLRLYPIEWRIPIALRWEVYGS